nr:MAG TPA_asm: hypothetical protein [Caudoviricetes sp.]
MQRGGTDSPATKNGGRLRRLYGAVLRPHPGGALRPEQLRREAPH